MSRLLEYDIENGVKCDVTKWARSQGIDVYFLKLTILGFRGWPDRLILWPGGGILFIEFKRPGEKPRKLQEYVHDIIRKLGFEIQVHDNRDIAVAAIKAKVGAAPRTSAGHEEDSGGGGV